MRTLLELLIALAAVPGLISAAATCYNSLGQPVEDWFPCNPGLPVSACCSSNDLCLSDGACLHAGSDNGFSIQGCTDQQWGIPCLSNCLSLQSTDFQRLEPCDLVRINPQFCCGSDHSCCDDADKVFDLPHFSNAVKPETTSVPTGSTTSASTGPSSTSTGGSKETTVPPGSADSSSNSKVTLGVGIGVGVGVGLPLVGAIVWCAYQLSKRNKIAATGGNTTGGMTYAGYPGQYEYPYGESPMPAVAQPGGAQEAPGNSIQEMPAK